MFLIPKTAKNTIFPVAAPPFAPPIVDGTPAPVPEVAFSKK